MTKHEQRILLVLLVLILAVFVIAGLVLQSQLNEAYQLGVEMEQTLIESRNN
jgi:hypothetical protein